MGDRQEWVTADNHFGHANIIKYCERPFSDVDEMDDVMVEEWNAVVGHHDIVHHLGDFCLGNLEMAQSYLSRLNGHITIVDGLHHHDSRWLRGVMKGVGNTYTATGTVMVVKQIAFLKHGDVHVVVSHNPFAQWDRKHHGAIHLHAHSHGNYQGEGRILDVGVDCHDFRPILLDTAIQLALAKVR